MLEVVAETGFLAGVCLGFGALDIVVGVGRLLA